MALIEFKSIDSELSAILDYLNSLGSELESSVHDVLLSGAKDIIETSKQREWVPVVTGRLRQSGHVEDSNGGGDTDISISMVYGGESAPYALKVHEDPRSGAGASSNVARSRGLERTFTSKSAGEMRRFPYEGKSKTGQWKYLEQPYLLAIDKVVRDVVAISDKEISK